MVLVVWGYCLWVFCWACRCLWELLINEASAMIDTSSPETPNWETFGNIKSCVSCALLRNVMFNKWYIMTASFIPQALNNNCCIMIVRIYSLDNLILIIIMVVTLFSENTYNSNFIAIVVIFLHSQVFTWIFDDIK